jgi:hypothetical protein
MAKPSATKFAADLENPRRTNSEPADQEGGEGSETSRHAPTTDPNPIATSPPEPRITASGTRDKRPIHFKPSELAVHIGRPGRHAADVGAAAPPGGAAGPRYVERYLWAVNL